MTSDRRRFLQSAAGLALAQAVQAQTAPPVDLPKVDFLGTSITRLIIGSNPFYGYSHFNPVLDKCMREWYTPAKRVEVLLQAEKAGLNTWQIHYNDPCLEDIQAYRHAGGKMNLVLLADFALLKDWTLLPGVVKKLKPLGIAHHGNRSDERLRNGEMNVVRDFTKAVKDAGCPAGVSCHNPAVVEYVEERGWPIEFYMTCLYRVSRTPEETRKEFGEAPLGETFMEKDPERMTKVVRQTRKPCLAFKVLGAGRNIQRPEALEAAFRFALTNIKPNDAVIVGHFPKFSDELRQNAELVKKICG